MIEVGSSTQWTWCLQRLSLRPWRQRRMDAKPRQRSAPRRGVSFAAGAAARRRRPSWSPLRCSARKRRRARRRAICKFLIGRILRLGVWLKRPPRPAQPTARALPNAAASPDDDKTKQRRRPCRPPSLTGSSLKAFSASKRSARPATTWDGSSTLSSIATGQVRAAIIDFGGFLGVGSRKIAVDWRSLHFDPKKTGAVVVNLTKDQLRVAPVYKAAEPVVMIGGPGRLSLKEAAFDRSVSTSMIAFRTDGTF